MPDDTENTRSDAKPSPQPPESSRLDKLVREATIDLAPMLHEAFHRNRVMFWHALIDAENQKKPERAAEPEALRDFFSKAS